MSVVFDGRVFVSFKQSLRELYSSLVGGGNATYIGCQPPLNLIEEEVLRSPYWAAANRTWLRRGKSFSFGSGTYIFHEIQCA